MTEMGQLCDGQRGRTLESKRTYAYHRIQPPTLSKNCLQSTECRSRIQPVKYNERLTSSTLVSQGCRKELPHIQCLKTNSNLLPHSSRGQKLEGIQHSLQGDPREESVPCLFQFLGAAHFLVLWLYHFNLCVCIYIIFSVWFLKGYVSLDSGINQIVLNELLISRFLMTSSKTFS